MPFSCVVASVSDGFAMFHSGMTSVRSVSVNRVNRLRPLVLILLTYFFITLSLGTIFQIFNDVNSHSQRLAELSSRASVQNSTTENEIVFNGFVMSQRFEGTLSSEPPQSETPSTIWKTLKNDGVSDADSLEDGEHFSPSADLVSLLQSASSSLKPDSSTHSFSFGRYFLFTTRAFTTADSPRTGNSAQFPPCTDPFDTSHSPKSTTSPVSTVLDKFHHLGDSQRFPSDFQWSSSFLNASTSSMNSCSLTSMKLWMQTEKMKACGSSVDAPLSHEPPDLWFIDTGDPQFGRIANRLENQTPPPIPTSLLSPSRSAASERTAVSLTSFVDVELFNRQIFAGFVPTVAHQCRKRQRPRRST